MKLIAKSGNIEVYKDIAFMKPSYELRNVGFPEAGDFIVLQHDAIVDLMRQIEKAAAEEKP